MPKVKISEFDVNPDNNTDINNINIAEGCAPSGINNAIRQLMSDLKEQQTGASGDSFTVGGAFVASGTFAANGGATLGDASGDALTINSSAVSIPNGLNFDSNTLVIDATNNRVGVGTASPSYPLVVNNSGSTEIQIRAGNTSDSVLLFGDTDSAAIGRITYAHSSNSMAFLTNSSEAMRITSAGDVGIGATTPTVYGSYKTLEVRGSGGGLLQIGTGATTAAFLFQDGTNSGFNNIANGVMTFSTNNTERMRITSSGVLELGQGQIKFPVTQVASSDANTLDDYEEGTWTPVLTFNGSAGVTAYNYQNGTYTKVGNVVTARGYISIATKSGATGFAELRGLPFEPRGGIANYSSGVMYMASGSITGAPMNYIIPSSTNVQLGQTNGASGFVSLTNSNFVNSGDLIFQVTYLTN